MNAQARYTECIATRHFCLAGLAWTRDKANLRKAWRACKNGNWMAWWLWDEIGIEWRVLKALVPNSVGNYSGKMLTGEGWTDQQRLQFAINLRRAFTPSGKPRNARRIG